MKEHITKAVREWIKWWRKTFEIKRSIILKESEAYATPSNLTDKRIVLMHGEGKYSSDICSANKIWKDMTSVQSSFKRCSLTFKAVKVSNKSSFFLFVQSSLMMIAVFIQNLSYAVLVCFCSSELYFLFFYLFTKPSVFDMGQTAKSFQVQNVPMLFFLFNAIVYILCF